MLELRIQKRSQEEGMLLPNNPRSTVLGHCLGGGYLGQRSGKLQLRKRYTWRAGEGEGIRRRASPSGADIVIQHGLTFNLGSQMPTFCSELHLSTRLFWGVLIDHMK